MKFGLGTDFGVLKQIRVDHNKNLDLITLVVVVIAVQILQNNGMQ